MPNDMYTSAPIFYQMQLQAKRIPLKGEEVSTFERHSSDKRPLKYYIKEKLCKGFIHGKALCMVGDCSEYHVMPRIIIIRRNVYQQVSEFDRDRIAAYRECELSLFLDIPRGTDRNPTTVIRIWNQWFAEGHTGWHAGSLHFPMSNAREDRHIVWLALQNRTTTSRTINQ
ncbi:hypothetical protein TNCV_5008611 [Trichonephila clavipes]|nr:hypothetical protein TNCV_5008611 [Trichonephila clavipes]